MGKRGPAGKPTSLRILHGDRKDRINDAEPVPPAAEIVPPEWLSEKGRAIWARLAPSMITRKILTAWDVDAFGVLCEALARYTVATALVNGSALLVPGGGGLVPNPALKVQADSERTFLTFAARFGLTPSDRQAIKAEVSADGGTSGDAGRLLS
ncbi:phage terminase small subunit P27 family [Amycolatopsis sp. EV170708-02-1]|uniref:phage terminase small subunit P27 family n=1 Tax=Amycolatopsis sp. EV170708-02-1 TaxID=2919322 RepID=UPI001F0B8D95|nr:phage terminase small subunit P27 family [Amycolatopsis sp. EV170708-02-1]UMP07544.1 phage terminase small subunit P27 family [Amycolatopsis sp. EV170708-02-1]